MRHFRCERCAAAHAEPDWEDIRSTSFCRACGAEGRRVVEWGCFECEEEGRRLWAPEDPVPECPDCGAQCRRVVYAPMLSNNEKRDDYAAADASLLAGLAAQKKSSTTLKSDRSPALAAHWGDATEVMRAGRGTGGAMPSVPKPRPAIVGAYEGR